MLNTISAEEKYLNERGRPVKIKSEKKCHARSSPSKFGEAEGRRRVRQSDLTSVRSFAGHARTFRIQEGTKDKRRNPGVLVQP